MLGHRTYGYTLWGKDCIVVCARVLKLRAVSHTYLLLINDCFRWLQPCTKAPLTTAENSQPCIHVNWSHDVKGPIGNGGGGQENQSYFDDVAWHKSRVLTLSGYVVYHAEYINAIVPLAASISGEIGEGKF